MKQVLQITISTKEENEKTVGILEISSKKKFLYQVRELYLKARLLSDSSGGSSTI